MAIIATSALGWTIESPQVFTADRPGPHYPTSTDQREIKFRNPAVADLLSATMWLIHTGVAGAYPDVYVKNWHGARALDATTGSQNSDHKAGAAMDINGPEHPWEVQIGTYKYNQHASSTTWTNVHRVFNAAQKKMVAPNIRPVVRWAGDSTWMNTKYSGYPVGLRDCMHFCIEEPDHPRIERVNEWLHTWFVPPKNVADIVAWQQMVGTPADGWYGNGSIAATRRFQRSLGVPATGLPGDVATLRAQMRT